MSEYFRPQTAFNATAATALYVVEEVKKHDSYCSGETRFAFSGTENSAGLMVQSLINELASQISKFNDATRESRIVGMTDMFQAVASEWMKRQPKKD